ncbi:HAD-like protein [Trematosphaeria pertusa]|uniref:HAD-like protein n=1 Tax=Trematosphaeria pertusa TaxID=390896 RepID=A0A6A6IGE8_9PLEO|nr:HAD-like protein [Trematosphaeria pertusa]KAF2249267.1 HAD-like protein [Trematosphaeria pertusa]
MRHSTLILDLGDVFFHWSTSALTALPGSVLHSVLLSPTWGALERGELSETAAVEAIGAELSIDPAAIQEALNQCRTTLTVDHGLVAQLKSLKQELKSGLKVFAMTNISEGDFARLRTVLPDWGLFDDVYTSFDARMRKPELGFYRHVVRGIGTQPADMIFVDDKIDNVIAARSFGMTGIVFESASALVRKLHNLLQDPVPRAKAFLARHAGNHMSAIENGPAFHDAFSQFLILDVTGDSSLVSLERGSPQATAEQINGAANGMGEARIWNYFIDAPVGTTTSFPDDVDTTACSLLALSPPSSSAHRILDAILANRNADNLVQTYFCSNRPRVDPVVLTNVVRAFYKYGRGDEVRDSLDFIRQTLRERGYTDGTLHYYSAESFLFFLSRLVASNPACPEVQALRQPLAEHLRNRVGRRDDSLAVVMRVLACQAVDVWAGSDLEYLKELQDVDGGWETGWVCRYGRSRKRIGNRGVVTSYAVKALETDMEKEKEPSNE